MTTSVRYQNQPWKHTLPRLATIAPVIASNSNVHQHLQNGLNQNPAETKIEWNERCFMPDNLGHFKDNRYRESVHSTSTPTGSLHPSSLGRSTLQQREDTAMSGEDRRRSSSPPSTSSIIETSTRFCLCQGEPHVPRPRNAFILFRQHQHAGVVAQHPGLSNPDISKIIGEQWRALSEQTKERWKALAEEEKTRHSQQYPDYRYRPRRSGRHSVPVSVSDPSSSSTEAHPSCQKCGGRVVSVSTPPTVSAAPATTSSTHAENMNQMGSRNVHGEPQYPHPQQVGNSQHQDKFFPPSSRPDVVQYEHGGQTPATTNNYGTSFYEQADTKRRRLNENIATPSGRSTFSEHHRSQHEYAGGRLGLSQLTPLQISPHAATSKFARSNVQRPVYTSLSRHDPNLVLPPLQTLPPHVRTQSEYRSLQAQKLGVEAMIMSIPVLNKIKILSQIAPSAAAPGPSTPASDIRGAVIAIEGMEEPAVFNMTHTLAEQLERNGNFAVRIFGGPVPYSMLDKPTTGSLGETESAVGIPEYLNVITRWHGISQEVKEYITIMPASNRSERASESTENDTIVAGAHIPAVSPKTVPRAGPDVGSPQHTHLSCSGQISVKDNSEPPRPKSRIPAAALNQQIQPTKPTAGEKSQDLNVSAVTDQSQRCSSISREPQPSQSQTSLLPSALSDHAKTDRPAIRARSHNPIPIALIPHYQLTTVNALAVTMPIRDNYSPHSHWQWLATLWRGCIGPDVTIAMKSTLDDGDITSADSTASAHGIASAHPPTPASAHPALVRPAHSRTSGPSPQSTGVEIRLSDFKTIVVKTGGARYGQDRVSVSSEGSSDAIGSGFRSSVADLINSESWEKAKRRVGFEVEEYLRK